jgi:hypothetical protein
MVLPGHHNWRILGPYGEGHPVSWSSGDETEGVTGSPSDGVAARRSAVRQAVVELVRTRPGLVEDADLLDGYLRDVCPSQPAEVAVVVVAARGGVPEELVHASEGHHVEAMAARLASRLNAEAGIDQVLARWAVDTWAIALGRTPAPAEADTVEMAVTAMPPPEPPAAAARTDGEALRAMVAPAKPSKKPAPPEPAPAPVSDGATLAPPAVGGPQKTRTRRPPAPPPPTPPPPPSSRERPSRRNIAVAAAVVVALAAVALVVSIGQNDGTETAGPPSTDSTEVEVTSTSTGPPTSTTPPRQFPSSRVPLAPGTYATVSFQPAATLTVGTGWEMLTPETSEFFELRQTEIPFARVSFMHLTEVFQAGATIRASSDIRKPGAVEPVPGDVAGWLAANPNLMLGPRSPVRTSGLTGTRFDVTVPTGYDTALCGGNRCVPLWPFKDAKPNEIGQLGPTLRHLLYALDVGDQKVLMMVATAPEDAARLQPEAEKVLATLRFAGR